ncbi:MAG: glycosyltransferase [Pseudomonadota bacterium]
MFEIVYLAFGYEYLLMALNSARSAKAFNPEASITIVTNLGLDETGLKSALPGIVNRLILVDSESIDNRLFKTRILDFTEHDRIVFLDCDTEVNAELAPVFIAMGERDYACSINDVWQREEVDVQGVNISRISPMNSGVMFFKNNHRVRDFFNRWHVNYKRRGMGRDQPSFSETLNSAAELRLLPLHWSWNAFPSILKRSRLSHSSKPQIYHYRHVCEDRRLAKLVVDLHRTVQQFLDVSDPIGRSDLEAFRDAERVLRNELFWFAKDRPVLMSFLIRTRVFNSQTVGHLVSRRSLRREEK